MTISGAQNITVLVTEITNS